MKILVTGSEGYIGKVLCRALENYVDPMDIIRMDRKIGQDLMTTELPDADLVFHMAAQADVQESIKDPMYDAEQNIAITIMLLQRYKAQRVILASSAAAKDPQSPYGVSKQAIEHYARILHPNAVVCRFPNVYGGEGGRGVVDIFKRSAALTIYGDGTQVRDFVHVDDIVRGLIMARDWEKGLYELGSGKGTSVHQLAMADGKPVRYEPAQEGEILESICENTTPDWEPQQDVLEYLKRDLTSETV